MSIVMILRRNHIVAIASDSRISGHGSELVGCKLFKYSDKLIAFATGVGECAWEYFSALNSMRNSCNSPAAECDILHVMPNMISMVIKRIGGFDVISTIGYVDLSVSSPRIIAYTVRGADRNYKDQTMELLDFHQVALSPTDEISDYCIDRFKSLLPESHEVSSLDTVQDALESVISEVACLHPSLDDRMQYWMTDLRTGEIREKIVPHEPLLEYYGIAPADVRHLQTTPYCKSPQVDLLKE